MGSVSFDRYVSGRYFDTYVWEGNDFIVDLQDFTTQNDIFYITPLPDFSGTTGLQNIGNNQWRQFYREVMVVPTTDIAFDHFYFNTHDNYQSFNFVFLLDTVVLQCNEFDLYNYNYRNYFELGCDGVLSAERINMWYQGATPDINGIIRSEHMYIHNGNNTAIHFSQCNTTAVDTLVLDQSSQNRVVIDGHVIAEHVESDASLELCYDDAVVTIGDLPANVKIFGNENTTVNLCKNPSNGADNMGYFKGTVMYNRGDNGWTECAPSAEGDINYNDNGSNYWVWKNADIVPVEIAAYDNFENCMDEYININMCLPEENVPELILPEKGPQYDPVIPYYDILGRKLKRDAVNSSKNGYSILKL